jgi:hypothetical protein
MNIFELIYVIVLTVGSLKFTIFNKSIVTNILGRTVFNKFTVIQCNIYVLLKEALRHQHQEKGGTESYLHFGLNLILPKNLFK